MKRERFHSLAGFRSFQAVIPAVALFSATCSSDNVLGGCQTGADSDGDGLTDDIECRIGSNPTNADTNGDGIPDGQAYMLGLDPVKLDTDGDGISDATELGYPKICVATDRNQQRPLVPPLRTGNPPAPACTTAADCQSGETCNGLDPTKADSDGDGVADALEDPNFDGTINFSSGETDPRLFDTDGDGLSDAMSGARICRPDGLAMIVRHGISGIQLGHDPVFGTAKDVTGVTMGRSTAVVDDAASGVAALVSVQPTTLADVRADSQALELAIRTKLGAANVGSSYIGQTFTTHEQLPAIHSTYVYTAAASTSASAVRDLLVSALSGGTAPGGATAGAGSTTFYLDIVTVRRSPTQDDLIVAVSPVGLYLDTKKSTAIRVEDLINATGVAEGSKDLDYLCQGALASRQPSADFIWTVDVSASMGDNQAFVGAAATTFVQKLNSAGVDFRVGVFSADGQAQPNLASTTYLTGNATYDNAATFPTNGWKNGFKMITGTTAMADRWMCRFVTAGTSGTNGYCKADGSKTADPWFPFGVVNGSNYNEEPAAAAVLLNSVLEKNMTNGVGNTNPDWAWRAGATKAAFFATDEYNNDWTRYFMKTTSINPDTGAAFAPGGTFNAQVVANIVSYFKKHQLATYGVVPLNDPQTPRTCNPTPDSRDLARCIIEGNGGAYLNILDPALTGANAQTLIDTAMDRIANDIIGASSPITLSRSPITSTIKVTVRGADVPRSRSDGFDYNQASRSIVFYGNTYRPNIGDIVYVSYRVWKGSLG